MKYADGEDAAALSSYVGLDLFPWQRAVLDDWCARDEDNKPSYILCGLDVPRQNGKNAILEAYELMVLTVHGWHVLHTAHRVKTSKRSFLRLVRYFTDKRHPELVNMVERIRRANGEEGIYLKNGASIEFAARSSGSARGFDDIQLVVYDEAQEMQDSHFQSIDFALSASSTDGGARQKIFTGTPPYEGCNGTVFARQRHSILESPAPRTTWSSWATKYRPKQTDTFDDVKEYVYESNPSMGYLLDIEYTETEFVGSTFIAFAQERLDWWAPAAARDVAAIPRKQWTASAIDSIADKYRGNVAFGVKFDSSAPLAAIVGCKLTKNGKKAAVELIGVEDVSCGTKQLARWLYDHRDRAACVVIDGLNGATALADNLNDLGPGRDFVVRPTTSNVIAAAYNFMDSLRSGDLAHTPSEELDKSALKSVRRSIGNRGGWGFGSTDDTSSAPIEAASLAYWGARNSKRNINRKQVLL